MGNDGDIIAAESSPIAVELVIESGGSGEELLGFLDERGVVIVVVLVVVLVVAVAVAVAFVLVLLVDAPSGLTIEEVDPDE